MMIRPSTVRFATVEERRAGLTFLGAQTVEVDDDDDQDAGDDPLPKGIHVEQVCAVVDGRQNERAEQRSVYGTDGAEEARATDNRGGNRLQFPALGLRRIADADPGSQQDANKGGA